MARRPEGWRLIRSGRPGCKVWLVRFTHDGERIKRSTGETDVGKAKEAAARIYAEVVSGLRPSGREELAPAPEALDVLVAEWLVAQEAILHESTVRQYEMYFHSRFLDFFKTLGDITTARANDYTRGRLRVVRRKSVLKELSALRGFLAWAKEQGHLLDLPTIESPPRKAVGRPDPKKRYKAGRVELSRAEVEQIIAQVPERSRGGFPAKAFFTVLWETGLRPGTVARLRAPDDYKVGALKLKVRAEADKARYDRTIPLSAGARAALDEVCPELGLLFGERDLRCTLRKAARDAELDDDKADRITPYDIRHARLTYLASRTTNLTGLAFLAGHRQVPTPARNVHGHYAAAEEVLVSAVTAGSARAPNADGVSEAAE